MQPNVLDQSWSAGSLLRFAFPTMTMMLFMGLYTIADMMFAARFVSTDALSAINIVCPIVNITVGLGTMLAAGGNAVIARTMGEGKHQEAKEVFTLLILTGGAVGTFLLFAGFLWADPILEALGASRRLFPLCKDYFLVLLLFLPANMLQTMFANLFVTAGMPGLGFGLSLLAGGANIALDYLFLVPCGLGIRGAALGTGFSCLIPAAAGLICFGRSKGPLSFTRPKWKGAVIRESCLNGSSELVGQLASALTTFLFNRAMMDLLGEDGVAAITILIYSQFLLNTLYTGYSMGVAPIIGFHYGQQNSLQQKTVFRISKRFLAAASLLVFAAARLGGPWLAGLFAEPASEVYQLAAEGFAVFSFSFLFCGWNIFASAMFTALSNGRVSALLSFLRTFVLLAGGILLLPRIWGVAGIWLAVPAAEGIMAAVSAACLLHYRSKYHY